MKAVPPEGRDDWLDVALPGELADLSETSAPGDCAEQLEGIAAQRNVRVVGTPHHLAALDAQRVTERLGCFDEPRRGKREADSHGISRPRTRLAHRGADVVFVR